MSHDLITIDRSLLTLFHKHSLEALAKAHEVEALAQAQQVPSSEKTSSLIGTVGMLVDVAGGLLEPVGMGTSGPDAVTQIVPVSSRKPVPKTSAEDINRNH